MNNLNAFYSILPKLAKKKEKDLNPNAIRVISFAPKMSEICAKITQNSAERLRPYKKHSFNI